MRVNSYFIIGPDTFANIIILDDKSLLAMAPDRLVEFHALLQHDDQLKSSVAKTNGNLDDVLAISQKSGFDISKGDWLKLQAMRLGGSRTSDDRTQNWDNLLLPLTDEERDKLVPPTEENHFIFEYDT